MNICLVITGLTMGGAERQVCDLADQFASMGHRVKLISLNKDPVVLPRSPDVIVTHLCLRKTPFGLLSGFFKLRKEINLFQPDVVHAHMVHANIMSRLVRIATPMKVLICTAHNSHEGGQLRQLMYRYTDRLNTIATNVSQEAVDTYIDKRISFTGRMIAVPNGLDDRKFRFSPEHRRSLRKQLNVDNDTFVFLSVGRLEQQKDYAGLINAFSILNGQEPIRRCILAIIGDGLLQEELEQLRDQAGLRDKVVFLGRQFNVNEWMSACDAYVLSSAWEGFGLVVAEAMLCERVVIATDCGGIKEVLGGHGFLIPPRSPEALAGEMLKVMSLDRERKDELGSGGRAHICEHFSMSRIASTWTGLYDRYLDSDGLTRH